MPTVPKRGTQQPEDNTADIQGLAHNMALSTAIAVVSTHARTYTASKKKSGRRTLPSDEAHAGRS